MQSLKLSLVLLVSFSVFGQKFNSKQCLDANFETEIKTEGRFFGLIKNDLSIKKEKCNISIKHKGILESIWNIDLCREPIHMKVTSKGSQNVFKRAEKCTEDSTDDFCYYLKELKTNLSDYGLIFAKGLKENLKDSHGQVYCTSLLINKYFDDAVVFSLFEEPVNLYSSKIEGCELPKSEESSSETSSSSTSVETAQPMTTTSTEPKAEEGSKKKF